MEQPTGILHKHDRAWERNRAAVTRLGGQMTPLRAQGEGTQDWRLLAH